MGILIPVSPGELIDKLTILSVKGQHVLDDKKRTAIAREYALLEQAWEDSPYAKSAGIMALWSDLAKVNARLWNLEDALRSPEVRANAELMAGVARCVSAENDLRAKLKNTINILLDSDLQEVKLHGSSRVDA